MLGAVDRVFQRAVLGHQPNGVIEVGIADLAALQRPDPEFALAVIAAAEGQHDRQGDLAFAEIVADVLAELCGLAAIVQDVVNELEGDAQIHADRAARGLLRLWAVCDYRPHLASRGEQLGRLAADHREVFVFGRGGILGGRQLHHLAFGDGGGGGRENVECAQRADLDHHPERLAEQEVADQHACLIAPEHARRKLAAPELALVDDVVVQERGGVHEFDRGGELDVSVAGIAGQVCHRQRQHRAQALASGGDQVVGDLRYHGHLGAGSRQDGGVDSLHVGGDEPDQRFYRGILRALERYNNRHAGLHFCRIRTILKSTIESAARGGKARKGLETVDIPRPVPNAGRTQERDVCGNWFEPTTSF